MAVSLLLTNHVQPAAKTKLFTSANVSWSLEWLKLMNFNGFNVSLFFLNFTFRNGKSQLQGLV
jgi:hypothetical protein